MTKQERKRAVEQVGGWVEWLSNRGRELQQARAVLAKPAVWRAKPENRKTFVDAARMTAGIDDQGINDSLKALEGVLQRLVAQK